MATRKPKKYSLVTKMLPVWINDRELQGHHQTSALTLEEQARVNDAYPRMMDTSLSSLEQLQAAAEFYGVLIPGISPDEVIGLRKTGALDEIMEYLGYVETEDMDPNPNGASPGPMSGS